MKKQSESAFLLQKPVLVNLSSLVMEPIHCSSSLQSELVGGLG